jgi:2-oxoglutarate ferredoxin oxidoreductase subunit alpha
MTDEALSKFKDDVSIVLCGEAGQGIQTVEYLLTRVLKLAGYYVFSTKEFMSRIRGGSNSTSIRVSSRRVSGYSERMDILIPLSEGAVTHISERLSENTVVLGEKKVFQDEYNGDKAIDVPFSDIASEVGGKIYSNTVAVALLSGLLRVDPDILNDYLKQQFSSKGEDIVEKNIEAAKRGYELSDEIQKDGKLEIEIQRNTDIKDEIIISGTDAVAMGAIAGGCNFLAFYPMSPSTGVAVFLAQQADDFGIVVEQAEDEIAAMNMVLGAWYAGARGLASTSGGGLALMAEGVSLAGIIESPVVIHLAQRPGPATGLPTRTEQGDLLFALFAGHGEFPRIMLTPGTVEDAFYLTQKAFNLTDKYQVPVFVITDQYLLDSYYNIPNLDLSGLKVEKHIVETDAEYKRYKITENGVSPRGIPGYGDGLVCLDSDEHDEKGYITEDFHVRTEMVKKRLRKFDFMMEDAIPPELIGSENYRTLLLGWGSTYSMIREAMEKLGRDDLAFLYFRQVHPFHPDITRFFERAERLIVIENNAVSQFSGLIKLHTGYDVHRQILKYNGLPFSVEELEKSLRNILG